MKFNTLTFDANLPTVQQVNVPTNSDYKVGMKVKRNGSVQSIKPSEYTIYTGEINVIPPTDYTSTTKTCEDASSMNLLSLKEADLSALAGQKIKYTDVYVEFSFDNGTTWSKLVPEVNSVMVQVIDRAGGTNNYIARLDLRNQNQKWVVLDHNVPTGEVADYVIIPDAARMSIQFLGSDWGSLTYPCLWRFIFLYGGYEERVTYPVDQEKTNGYVTITKASGDEATFKQYGVHIAKGYDFDDYIKLEGLATTSDKIQFPSDTTAESLGIGGMRIYANKMRLGYKTDGTQPLTPADITTWFEPATISFASFIVFNWPNGQAAVWMGSRAEGKLLYMPLGSSIAQVVDYVDIDPSWILRAGSSGVRPNLNKYYIVAYDLQLGTPFSADFKLNINEFKSQVGDIAETLADGSSVKVDGTYADGTTFSFDFCTK